MHTSDWIDFLAQGAGPVPRAAAARRLLPAALAGLLLASLLAVAVGGPLPAAAFASAMPWTKLAYAAGLGLAGGLLCARLGRPVARLGWPLALLAGVLLAMAGYGLWDWWQAPPPERRAELMGHSWSACPWLVLGLSLPALAGGLWALRGLAPTRPAWAGAAAGLLAGALGAAGYAFSCTETSPAFVAAWYTLGIGLSTALGAVLGPRCLRW